MSTRVAILVVNGFDRTGRWGPHDIKDAISYPWIRVCLQQVARYSTAHPYRILIYDNSRLEDHWKVIDQYTAATVYPKRRYRSMLVHSAKILPSVRFPLLEKTHPRALDYLVAHTTADDEYIITLDTDAFPVRSDWIEVLISNLDQGAAISGVYRNEMMPKIRPFIHVSCLCIRRSTLLDIGTGFADHRGQDVGQAITEDIVQRGWSTAPLTRSNAVEHHFLMGGLYGDIVYHHGAGSRHAKFWTSMDEAADEAVRVSLRQAAFSDVDQLIAELRGRSDDATIDHNSAS